jgi:hypothetical protein
MVRPFLLAGFDARQIRPRLPAPGQARFRASPRQARPDYRRQAWGTPLACGLKPSGNRTVKTLHRSVFSQSSGRKVSSLAAFSRQIFAHRLRLAQGYTETCVPSDCAATFPPIIITH